MHRERKQWNWFEAFQAIDVSSIKGIRSVQNAAMKFNSYSIIRKTSCEGNLQRNA